MNSEQRQVAQDESTAPEKLRELATNKDYLIRKYVAENPNTPTEILLNLGAEFPHELLNNPIFSLLLLENTNLIEDLPLLTKKSLLKCETVPRSLMEWAVTSSDEEVLFSLTFNPNTHNQIIQTLSRHKNIKIADAARLHINTSIQNEQNKAEILIDSIREIDIKNNGNFLKMASLRLIPKIFLPLLSPKIRKYMSLNYTDDKYLERLLNDYFVKKQRANDRKKSHPGDKAGNIIQSLVENIHTPITILTKVIEHDDFLKFNGIIREKIIDRLCWYERENINNISILEKLIDEKYKNTHSYIAQNANIPHHIFEQLLKVSTPPFYELANNSNMPTHILEKIIDTDKINSETEKNHILRFVCANYNTPIEFVETIGRNKLNMDEYKFVLASRPDTSTEILKELSIDTNRQIRGIALRNPGHPNNLAKLFDNSNNVNLIERHLFDINNLNLNEITKLKNLFHKMGKSGFYEPNDPELLAILSQSILMSGNIYHSERILEILCQHKNVAIRKLVARTINTPKDALEYLAKDEDIEVRESAIETLSNKSKDSLTKFLENIINTTTTNYFSLYRLIPFFHPEISPNLLAENAYSNCWWERYAIAQNPNTPHPIIQRLARDGNRIVRSAAQARLKNEQ